MYFIMLLLPVINLKTLALDYQYDVETLFYTNAMRDRDSTLSPWKQTIFSQEKAVKCYIGRSESYNKSKGILDVYSTRITEMAAKR